MRVGDDSVGSDDEAGARLTLPARRSISDDPHDGLRGHAQRGAAGTHVRQGRGRSDAADGLGDERDALVHSHGAYLRQEGFDGVGREVVDGSKHLGRRNGAGDHRHAERPDSHGEKRQDEGGCHAAQAGAEESVDTAEGFVLERPLDRSSDVCADRVPDEQQTHRRSECDRYPPLRGGDPAADDGDGEEGRDTADDDADESAEAARETRPEPLHQIAHDQQHQRDVQDDRLSHLFLLSDSR